MLKQKVFITGSNGFLGRNLKEYWSSAGAEVAAPVRAELNLLDSSSVSRFVTSFSPDIVLHCANTGGTRKTGYDAGSADVVSDNLRMYLNLSRCLKPGMRMINMGSGAEYDHRAYLPKMKEEFFDVNVPEDPYGFSKYAISQYVARAENIISLRIFGLFGKYEDYTFKFISNSIVKNLLGLPIVINQNVRFDYLYVSDFFRLVEKFSGGIPRYKSYNVTPTQSIDLVGIAELINMIGKQKSEVRVLTPGLNREYTGDNSRLLAEFPDFKFTPYPDAIRELYDYYAANLGRLNVDAVKSDPYIKNCRTAG
jgi:GDP-L-fucose synthase